MSGQELSQEGGGSSEEPRRLGRPLLRPKRETNVPVVVLLLEEAFTAGVCTTSAPPQRTPKTLVMGRP